MRHNMGRGTVRDGRGSSFLARINQGLTLLGDYLAGYANALRTMADESKPGGSGVP